MCVTAKDVLALVQVTYEDLKSVTKQNAFKL